MAVKITQDGISKVQENVVDDSEIVDNGIGYEDLPGASIIQVVRTFTAVQTSITVNTTAVNIPNLDCTITPKLSGSHFLVIARIFGECADGWNVTINATRDNQRISSGGATENWFGLTMPALSYASTADNNSTPEMVNLFTVDDAGSTAGTPITYRITGQGSSAFTYWINRCFSTAYETGTSELIIVEIKNPNL